MGPKATVDAYDGTVTLYQQDENDPVLKAWKAGRVPMETYPAGSAGPDGWLHRLS